MVLGSSRADRPARGRKVVGKRSADRPVWKTIAFSSPMPHAAQKEAVSSWATRIPVGMRHSEWRGPESNRRHHDFQSVTRGSLTGREIPLVEGFRPVFPIEREHRGSAEIAFFCRGFGPRNAARGPLAIDARHSNFRRIGCVAPPRLARTRTLAAGWEFRFLASRVQRGTTNGAARPDPARRRHLGGLARAARTGVVCAMRETPRLE